MTEVWQKFYMKFGSTKGGSNLGHFPKFIDEVIIIWL
jgi:hypothetical protein